MKLCLFNYCQLFKMLKFAFLQKRSDQKILKNVAVIFHKIIYTLLFTNVPPTLLSNHLRLKLCINYFQDAEH